MIVDYHMHLRNGSEELAHDTWSVDPFVGAAREAGVDEIGFTEHIYYFKQTRSLWTVPYMVERRLQILHQRLPDLFKRVEALEKKAE